MATKETAKEMAERLADAYSTERYNGGWAPCIRMLRAQGFDDLQIEAILRSKWTRWAADQSSSNQFATSEDLKRWMNGQKNLLSEVRALTAEHFGVAEPPAEQLLKRIKECLKGIDPGDMTTAERQIWAILIGARK